MGRAVFTGRLLAGGQALRPIQPLILAQSRTTIALLILLPILLLTRRSSLRVRSRSHLLQFFVLGILGLAVSNYFYYLAIQKTSVATAIVLQYVAPIWVLLYMLARRLQRPTMRRISGVVLAVLGCALAVGELAARREFPWLVISGIRFNALGVVAAELAAISFAFYNVYGQHLLQIYDRWTVLVYALLGAAVFWQIVNPPWKIIAQHYSGGQWLFMADLLHHVHAGSVLALLRRIAASRSHARHRDRLSGTRVGDSADCAHPRRIGVANAGARNRGRAGGHHPGAEAGAPGPPRTGDCG